jgi:hypothetical protein
MPAADFAALATSFKGTTNGIGRLSPLALGPGRCLISVPGTDPNKNIAAVKPTGASTRGPNSTQLSPIQDGDHERRVWGMKIRSRRGG